MLPYFFSFHLGTLVISLGLNVHLVIRLGLSQVVAAFILNFRLRGEISIDNLSLLNLSSYNFFPIIHLIFSSYLRDRQQLETNAVNLRRSSKRLSQPVTNPLTLIMSTNP